MEELGTECEWVLYRNLSVFFIKSHVALSVAELRAIFGILGLSVLPWTWSDTQYTYGEDDLNDGGRSLKEEAPLMSFAMAILNVT
jgi:hypothetical protein